MNWSVGQTLLEQYRIRQVFTSGGMGLVYQVSHLGWGIDLALKRPRDDFAKSSSALAAFEDEIETWAELGLHPNIATCYYSRRLEGVPCVFAEYVDGGSLRDWISSRRLYQGGEESALSRILSIAVQFAWGLDWAHQHGLVHQDVKPGNVLMTADGTAKVTDFGLARGLPVSPVVPAAPANDAVTLAGMTLPYASPEQVERHRVTRATDIWSWAVSIMEMFMGGIHWHSGPAAAEALNDYGRAGRRSPGMPAMPAELFALLSRCLNRDPSGRPDSCAHIADTLMEIHEQMFGEPCDALQPDVHVFAADALNNRGVSLMDVGRTAEATQRFQKAVALDPFHPEAVCNYMLALHRAGRISTGDAGQRMEAALREHQPETAVLRLFGQTMLWLGYTARAKQLLQSPQEQCPEISPMLAPAQRDRYFLAKPRTGAEHMADASRFKRLLSKAESAISEARHDDARRYLQMAGEIPGFKRHPGLIRLNTRRL